MTQQSLDYSKTGQSVMQDEPSQSMQVELYAASLRADYSDAGAFLEALAVSSRARCQLTQR
jgi:hypothetical protein